MDHGIIAIDGPIKRIGKSYWASSAGKAIVKRAVRETTGVKVVKISILDFDEPNEERGNRKYHIAVGGSIQGVNTVNARIDALSDKIEGTKPPTTLYEKYFVRKVRVINKFT